MNILGHLKGLLALALLALVVACAAPTATPPLPTPTPPITVTDSEGTTVVLEALPQRIVSLGPSNTEILYALGVGALVVGVDDYSDYPPGAVDKPKVGAPFPSFSLEVLLALEPDLVLSIPLSEFNDQIRASGIPVVVLDPRSIEDILRDILLVGSVVGADEEATFLVEGMEHRIKTVEDKTRDVRKAQVFYEVDATDPTKPYTVGPGSFVDSLITLAGGENIFGDAKSPYPQVNLEVVVSRDPKVILLGDALVPYNPQTPEIVAARPGWGIITAVQNGDIIEVDANLVTRPGPRIIEGLELIARTLHPELFP